MTYTVVPLDEQIDLMVLSYNDTDHFATADHILAAYDVKKANWSGFERPDTVSGLISMRALTMKPAQRSLT